MFCWVSGSWRYLAQFKNNSQFLPHWLFYLDHLTHENEGTILLQNFGDHSHNSLTHPQDMNPQTTHTTHWHTHPQDMNPHQTCYYSVGKVIPAHTTKPYVEMEVQLHAFPIFPALYGTNTTTLHRGDRDPGTHRIGCCAGPTVDLCTLEKRKISCLYQELNHVPPVASP